MANAKLSIDELETKVPDGLDIGPGWFSIVQDVDAKIRSVYPEYDLTKVYSKYGTLRIETGPVPEEHYLTVFNFIGDAEELSSTVCEVCGDKDATLRIQRSKYYNIFCPECANDT